MDPIWIQSRPGLGNITETCTAIIVFTIAMITVNSLFLYFYNICQHLPSIISLYDICEMLQCQSRLWLLEKPTITYQVHSSTCLFKYKQITEAPQKLSALHLLILFSPFSKRSIPQWLAGNSGNQQKCLRTIKYRDRTRQKECSAIWRQQTRSRRVAAALVVLLFDFICLLRVGLYTDTRFCFIPRSARIACCFNR